MRVETWGGKTWLLAAVAGWAVLVWLLAVLGMGSRIAPSAGGEPHKAELPAVPVAAFSRLQDFDSYAQIAERPVFSADRRPQVFQLVKEAQPAMATDVRLTGVLITPGLQMATLQTPAGASLRVRLDGPEVAGWRLVSLQPRAAVVEGSGGARRLELQTYGQPPQAPALPPATPPGDALPQPTTDAAPRALEPAAVTPEQIEAIRQRIEERRRELQQDQAEAPAPVKHP